MHFITRLLLLTLAVPHVSKGLEPPFPPNITEAINDFSNTSTLISINQLLAGIDPSALEAAFNTSANTNNTLPNPIASTFPNLTTAIINATYLVLPIDFALARSIVPNQYRILRESIQDALPGFPADKFPLLFSTQTDHDVQTAGLVIADFKNAYFRFPFVDLLGDGYSTFSYLPALIVTNNAVAIVANEAYGIDSIPAIFDPLLDPYSREPGTNRIYSNANRINSTGPPFLNTSFVTRAGRYGEVGAYPLSFYANVTNQPAFGCTNSSCLLTCDNQIRFFNTNVTAGQFRPLGIIGHVSLAPAIASGIRAFPQGGKWSHVHGVKAAVAFTENNYRNCSGLEGFQYLGV